MIPRSSGVFAHITSLPSPFGCGVLGAGARKFVDFLAESTQRYWQILPLVPTDSFGSPYCSASAFAGEPMLIDPQTLLEEGLLAENELPYIDAPDHADFSHSKFLSCTFSVCRIIRATFEQASLYSSDFYGCEVGYANFYHAGLSNTRFEDCTLFSLELREASMKSCGFLDCGLSMVNFLRARLDGCSFGRVTASGILELDTAQITQGGATEEECRRNRASIFRELGVRDPLKVRCSA